MDNIKFGNIIFLGLLKENLLSESQTLKVIVTANAEFIVHANEDEKFKKILNENYTTFDGQVPYLMARLQNKNVQFEKLSGSDLIYDFCEMARVKKKKIFLLGGLEESNRLAVKKLKEMYGIQIEGYSPPYKSYPFDKFHNQMIIEKVKAFSPDILFVGFGALKQEFWIDEHKQVLNSIGIRWAIGSGGTFEFVAGTIKRAPSIVQKAGLEGVWRLLNEPKLFRLKRLLISFKVFKYIWSRS